MDILGVIVERALYTGMIIAAASVMLTAIYAVKATIEDHKKRSSKK